MPEQIPESVRSRIRQVLLDEWDPSNASRFEHSRGGYSAYIPALSAEGEGE